MEKVHIGMSGDSLEVETGGAVRIKSGGILNLETGAIIQTNGAQAAALTAQLTTITHTAPVTPDYALQDLTDTGGFGFASKDEGNSVLKVIANLQARLAEVESRLESAGFVKEN
ncbi:MAG: hypothetical protein NTX56_02710 [Proteobacteria bacterium]|nr:hypothetical protein [Pseudomonadota bacterium]